MSDVQPVDVERALTRIRARVHHTPVVTCAGLDALTSARLHFKCENLQKTGSFKIRGACNAVFSLDGRDAARGVAAHSSGNHAAALAQAAAWRGIRATVVVPDTASRVKRAAAERYGASIVPCGAGQTAREQALDDLVSRTGAVVVHPHDDPDVIAGQGTAVLELCEQVEGLDAVLAPVGGGGLLSGSALAARYCSGRISVIGVEPERVDDAARSVRTGVRQPPTDADSIADGLLTSLGELPFRIIRSEVEDIVTVSEDDIVRAMRLIWECTKLIVEPSSAVPLASLTSGALDLRGRAVGIVLSGGNVDLDNLPW
ncbi:MAG: threonine/serine dehydratase [Gammaproteobacteria bacterium]|nr:threonine/serine dehydratase [Gammaproteobacteria bacterium]